VLFLLAVEVVGTQYFHTFSAAHPVLARVKPGQRIVTKTVDSAGFDYQGVRRTKTHGNPLTGAFYIEGAEPGDALAVRIDQLSPNRPSGYSGPQVGVKNLPDEFKMPKPGMDRVYKGYDYLYPWKIDLSRGKVSAGRLEFDARPMLGCMGVAPQGDYSPRSGPASYWGGNMDYNMVKQGSTVLFPVSHPGGLLFFGDGHALQGDGEAVGAGIETSLDVEVTVEVRKGWKLTTPRLETSDWIVSIGVKEGANLNEGLEIATLDMLRWLTKDYGFTPQEAHLLIGMQAKYEVISFAGGIALRIPRSALARR
jgi:amidase